MIAQKWTQLPGMLYRQVRGDCVYIRQQPLSKKEKIHWAFYSLFRNFDRFVGGYLGGKYHLYSKRKQQFLDRHISQQYDQRHAIRRKEKRNVKKPNVAYRALRVSEESWIKRND